MIWLSYGGGPMPAGARIGQAEVVGSLWDVSETQMDGWRYLAYKVTSPLPSPVVGDVGEILKNAVQLGWLDGNLYILGVQAGFEIWECSGAVGRSVVSITVN
jgi:hypothetical protein